MISVYREKKVFFMEGFMYQFHPQHNRLKEIVASGEIGEVKSVRVSLSFFLENQTENIRMNSSLGGGSLYDVGCYCIHAIRHLNGSEPVRVIASNRIHPVYQVDTCITGMLEVDNGITALFDAAMDRVKTETYELIGTKGMIEVKRAFTPHLFQSDGILVVTNENGEERSEHL
jgi:D-xylose 1-dehydrogenase (NADP+, D-xylono-1,5-lactone-forming)